MGWDFGQLTSNLKIKNCRASIYSESNFWHEVRSNYKKLINPNVTWYLQVLDCSHQHMRRYSDNTGILSMKREKNIRILHISCLPFSKKHDATEKVNRPAKEKLGRKFEKLGEMSRFYVTNDLECKILILNVGNMQQVSVSSVAH